MLHLQHTHPECQHIVPTPLPPDMGHHQLLPGYCDCCLTGLPASTFNSPLPLHHRTARMTLSKQDRTFYNSTQNPKMPHPFHSEEKPVITTCTRRYSVQFVPSENSFPNYSAPCLLSSYTAERFPSQDLCVDLNTLLKQLLSCLHQ